MRETFKLLCLTIIFVCGCVGPDVFPRKDSSYQSLAQQIRLDHPRLFFNKDTWPQIKERAFGAENAWYLTLKKQADRYPIHPDLRDHGVESAVAALLFRLNGDSRYLELAKKLLARSLEYYHVQNNKGFAADWYSTSRINALAAFDWIFNDLSRRDRQELGRLFFFHIWIENNLVAINQNL